MIELRMSITFPIFLMSCGLPGAGPTHHAMINSAIAEQHGYIHIIGSEYASHEVVLRRDQALSDQISSSGELSSDIIFPGDFLKISVIENVTDGVFSVSTQRLARLPEIEASDDGTIFVPYIGVVNVAGLTTEGVRTLLVDLLDDQTPAPQITVFKVPGPFSTVLVLGEVETQGVYPIVNGTSSLSAIIAAAGGPKSSPNDVIVSLTRNGKIGTAMLNSISIDPLNDIIVEPGDRILVQRHESSVAVLGAINEPQVLRLSNSNETLLMLLARAGGLDSNSANPRGIFLLRDTIVDGMNRHVVIHFDLTIPSEHSAAVEFVVRDGDTIYVTESNVSRLGKILNRLADQSFPPLDDQ
jgi:polysaccharide biosynthesis/export protein